jgi:hypothetical protein
MRVGITGAVNFIHRAYEAAGAFQWAREFLVNAMEAGAKHIQFGHVDGKRTIIDDGAGMDKDELLRFFSTLGESGKKIGGVHENFGLGAKVSSLPWNPDGVVVISKKEGKPASMLRICRVRDEYELVEHMTDHGPKVVVDPEAFEWPGPADFSKVLHHRHGTAVVLMGSRKHPNTLRGNPDVAQEAELKGLSAYLNERFWDLQNVDVTVAEARSGRPDDRVQYRRILGAHHFLADIGKAQRGVVDLGKVKVEWYLSTGNRPSVHAYARETGYVAVRYKGELFHHSTAKPVFRRFGVIESKVQSRLTLIIEPQRLEEGWGVHPDQSRTRLIFTGDGKRGAELPMDEWGLAFTEHMPKEVMDAIQEARGDSQGTLESEEYRRRLQDRFGSRWVVKALAQAPGVPTTTGTIYLDEQDITPVTDEQAGGRGESSAATEIRPALIRKADHIGPHPVVEVGSRVDVPRYRFAHADAFEQPWHLALWAPHDPSGPTVLLNVDSPILEEAVKHHVELYPDVYSEEVSETVRRVFGEVAVAKVAHVQKLSQHIPEEVLDRDYRSEQALTVGLMGLLAEESLVGSRLGGKLGRYAKAKEVA